MTLAVKICGLTSPDTVQSAVNEGASYVGFVFFPKSPRHVTPEKAASLAALVPETVKKVVVAVNITNAEIEAMLRAFTPDYLQLHGDESEARVREIKEKYGIPVIKAIAVRKGDDIACGLRYSTVADMLLFDAKAPEAMPNALPGGNGLVFDWNLLAGRSFPLPWMLSGGLNAENVQDALRLSGANMVDVSSSVELRPGVKSAKLIAEFIRRAKGSC